MTPEEKLRDDVRRLLPEVELDEDAMDCIIKEAGYQIGPIKDAVDVLRAQKTEIVNVVGWLIIAIRKNYKVVTWTPPKKKNDFNNFEQRKYTPEEMEALEKKLLAKNHRSKHQ